jgi:hypothetical protein
MLPVQPLNEHGDEDAFDDHADDRLGGGKPRLQGVSRTAGRRRAVDTVEADLQRVGALQDSRDGAVEQRGQKEEYPTIAPISYF